MKILIVDDEVDICKRLQRELKKGGFEVEYTTSPVGVIERLHNAENEEKPYEILLLDLRMPKVNGLELLKKIREVQLDLDVIIITGYGDEDKAIEAIRLGAVDYLPKPISLDDLHVAIFRIQQKRAMEAKQALRHRILVVDDEKDLCARIKHELDREGYQTAVAYDGDEGLNYFKDNKVDIVVADIRMPRMSGLEMLENCRKITDDFVSIIITGHGDHETAIGALRLGVLNYLRKPISLEELFVSVDKGIEMLLLRRGLSARRRELEIETALKEQYAKNLEKMVDERTKALRESEERFRSLVETTSDWIWEVDENAVYIYASPKVKDILGYEPCEIVGKTLFDLMPADEAERIAKLFLDISQARRPFEQLENVNQHKDGRLVVLETSGIPIIDTNGKFRGYRGVDRDITERKAAEETVRRQQEHFRIVIENIFKFVPESILVFTEKMNLFKQNKAFDDLLLKYSAKLGYTEQELSEIIIEQIKKRIAEGEDKEIKIAKKRR